MYPLNIHRPAFCVATLLALGSLAVRASPPVLPAERPDARVVVKTADLNLFIEADRRVLDTRIAAAARHACTAVVSASALDFHAAMAECYREAVALTHARVDAARSIVLAEGR